jgi:hypothetical protein
MGVKGTVATANTSQNLNRLPVPLINTKIQYYEKPIKDSLQ